MTTTTTDTVTMTVEQAIALAGRQEQRGDYDKAARVYLAIGAQVADASPAGALCAAVLALTVADR